MTWAVGIAQLTHHSVRGGGKNPSTFGLGIFAPTLNLVVSQLRNTDRPCRFAIIYDTHLNVKLMAKGPWWAYGGLPFSGTGCPVPDIDFNYFIHLYQMLEMINASYQYVCNDAALKDVSVLHPSLRPLELTGYPAGVFHAL